MQANTLQNLIALARSTLSGERLPVQPSNVMGGLWAGITEAEAELEAMRKPLDGPGSEQRAVAAAAQVAP